MQRPDDDTPFPREPWQRLLGTSTDGPPETTDARIRAAARRGLSARGRRWWLPASLAASFVLAVVIVNSEFGSLRRPAMTESDATSGAAVDARPIERGPGLESRESDMPEAAPQQRAAPARAPATPEESGDLDEQTGRQDAGAEPRVGGPEVELRAASERPAEAAADAGLAETPEAKVDAPSPPSPEAWYARIRTMIAEGRRADAARELEALRKAYPEWAAKNVNEDELR
jgi:hypothetical protein